MTAIAQPHARPLRWQSATVIPLASVVGTHLRPFAAEPSSTIALQSRPAAAIALGSAIGIAAYLGPTVAEPSSIVARGVGR